jgi:hypothetical protein
MVGFGVVLMIMFLSNMGPQGTTQNSPVLRTVAKIGSTKITQLQLNNASDEWNMLKTLEFTQGADPQRQPIPFVLEFLGRELTETIDKSQKLNDKSPLFFLLLREADREGVFVTREEVESLVTNNVLPPTQPDTDARERVEAAVSDCLRISKLANRAANMIKVSRPLQEFELATLAQDLTVSASVLRASSVLKNVPEPTDAQVQAQYDKFKNRVAAVPDKVPSQYGAPGDPLGFGYETPNRVTLQYIGLDLNDLAKAAVNSKSKEDWYVAAFGEFKANRADYDSQPVASTQPASATQPSQAPVKLDNIGDDFALHADLVLRKLYHEQAQALEQSVLKEITEKMSAGYGNYRDAVAASGGKGLSGAAADYTSYKFIRDLADSIQQKFGVTPLTGSIAQFKSESQLADLQGIGSATIGGSISFPVYAVELFQPWLSDAEKNTQRGALALSLWQASNPIQDQSQNVYIFRITGSDPAHVPPLADVKDQVIADCKISAAYDIQLKAAQALLAAANKIGLAPAALAAKLDPPIVTDSFNPEEIADGSMPAVVSPLILVSDSARDLARISQKLLITPAARGSEPNLLAELYADRAASVVELREAKPSWDAQTKPRLTAEVVQGLRHDLGIPLELSLFDAQAVADRVGYKVLPR